MTPEEGESRGENNNNALKDSVVRRKTMVLDELLALEVERTKRGEKKNASRNTSDSDRPSSGDESVRFIQGLHAGANNSVGRIRQDRQSSAPSACRESGQERRLGHVYLWRAI